jgi:hypothetical protein
MSLEIARLRNGMIALLTDELIHGAIQNIQYFSGDHHLKINYENDKFGRFLPCPLNDKAITAVEAAFGDILIVEVGQEKSGYYVPFFRISEK